MITPSTYNLISALAIRPRCETDAFTLWCGSDPRETNIWTVENSDSYWKPFRDACRKAGIIVKGQSMDGFTYYKPSC